MNRDQVVIVTGAGGGIGREIALEYARGGAKVLVNDIGVSLSGEGGSSAPGAETVRMIEELGGQAVHDAHSVASWQGAQAIVSTALDRFGRLDVVVNNAGILRDRIFHKMSPEEWEAVVNVHLNGTFYVSRAAADPFRAQESGAFVHITSTSGLIGNFGQANYSAAKLGITALSKSIALDMARYNVRSNCLAPFAWSRMTEDIPNETEAQKIRVALLKQMTPSKNAPLAAFLGSPEAAAINGQVFAVRNNEIFLMGQSRPVRSVHRGEGWTGETLRDHMLPALKPSFYGLERSGDVISWDPI
ncbi:MAG: SDR family NAD(P)-dependent oxidoreductase [Paracoccus denitrificans]|uniref:SDR family NAD(P)-dependent oxidoreductase n=1 Tax=Paracoccus denitrificans TaxID=266 RepID=A0A533I6L0_PARDE|nr:MAG: SDR family NAD(P)-dependent oxidoreductase [Paracoccus denitrificans]